MNEIQIKKQQRKTELLDILDNQRTAQKLLRYLDTEDVHNLMKSNRRTYFCFFDPKTYIYNKYMFKKYGSNYLFFYYYNKELKNLNEILEVINYSDGIYEGIYNKTDKIVIIYYFIGCFLILDLFVLFVMIDNSASNFNDYLPQIPLVIFWVLCILQLIIIFLIEKNGINKIKKYFRQKNIVEKGSQAEKKILKNISKRLRHKKPVSYRAICYTYILCFLPIIYKSFFTLSYASAFLYISIIFCSTGLIIDFALFAYHKFLNKLSKIDIYQRIFWKNQDYFIYRLLNILSYSPEKNVSEMRLNFQYYFYLSIFHGVIILYAYLIGKKLDNSKFGISWRILLIPLYIICFIIILWGIIYIYSIKQHKSEYKIVLVVTILIILVCTATNCVFFPNFYLSNKGITRYFPIVIDCIITLTCMVHYFFLYKSKKKYLAEDI